MGGGGQKIKSAEKFMNVEFDVKYIQANFGWLGLSGFGNFTHFLPLKMAKISFQKLELAEKIHACRG